MQEKRKQEQYQHCDGEQHFQTEGQKAATNGGSVELSFGSIGSIDLSARNTQVNFEISGAKSTPRNSSLRAAAASGVRYKRRGGVQKAKSLLAKDALLRELVEELVRKHRCHTVLLYGSRARGDATPASDYDLAGIRKARRRLRITEKRNGSYVDVFLLPERSLKLISEEHLHMRDAIVLFQSGTFGSTFIRRLERALRKGYKPLADDEIHARRIWAHKMLDRIRMGDVEGHYRRSWLHQALLIDYFDLRRQRYWGSKESFVWLEERDPATFRLFKISLANPTNLAALRRLVERVTTVKSKTKRGALVLLEG